MDLAFVLEAFQRVLTNFENLMITWAKWNFSIGCGTENQAVGPPEKVPNQFVKYVF
jgi:hypothetical protein